MLKYHLLQCFSPLLFLLLPIVATAQQVRDTVVDERMPLFYAEHCQLLDTYEQIKPCADRAMLEFIYGNLKYPPKARRREVEGIVVVSFIVERDGSISSEEIVRNLGVGTGDEVLRVVQKMKQLHPWTPGMQDGEYVRVQFNLPVQFALTD